MPKSLFQRLGPKRVVSLISYWPPLWAAGIRVLEVNDALTRVKVALRQTWWNRNYAGVHYGGSLYSMCDPFFVFILSQHLQKEHIIWDQAASITYKKPGRGELVATFEVEVQQIEDIRQQAADGSKVLPVFQVQVLDAQGDVVAEVEKTLYVRRKDFKQQRQRSQNSPQRC